MISRALRNETRTVGKGERHGRENAAVRKYVGENVALGQPEWR